MIAHNYARGCIDLHDAGTIVGPAVKLANDTCQDFISRNSR
jgi:hypothetical protein